MNIKKLSLFLLTGACLFSLAGCKESRETPPSADLNASFNECWPGTITDIFTEGGGSDLAEVIELEVKDHDPMYFTIVEDTEYLRYDSDTGETETITRDDLYTGAWVEIDCESYHNSDYHSILTIKIIEGTENNSGVIDPDAVLTEPPELTVVCYESAITAMRGGYSWEVVKADGMVEATIADSMHPLDCKDFMPSISLMPTYLSHVDPFAAYLDFEVPPDEVRVHCWSEACWGQYDAESEGLAVDVVGTDFGDEQFVNDFVVHLKDGSYIYEVVAEWHRSEQYSGTAHYSFYTVNPDLELHPMEDQG